MTHESNRANEALARGFIEYNAQEASNRLVALLEEGRYSGRELASFMDELLERAPSLAFELAKAGTSSKDENVAEAFAEKVPYFMKFDSHWGYQLICRLATREVAEENRNGRLWTAFKEVRYWVDDYAADNLLERAEKDSHLNKPENAETLESIKTAWHVTARY